MGPDLKTWQMVIDVEREIAIRRAARFGTLGEPPRGSNLVLGWLRRRGKPARSTPAPVPHVPAREAGV